VQQLTVVYKRAAQFFKVTDLVAPTLIVGEKGVLRAKLMNMNTRAMSISASLSLPTRWACSPEQLGAELDPRDAAEFSFSITCPPGVESGLYLGELRATYEGGELVQGFTLNVTQPSIQLSDYVPYLAALGCVVVVGVVVLKWPRKVYREKVVRLLKRIKREA
jgi:hypothetical protein